jgi:hypothetical protein
LFVWTFALGGGGLLVSLSHENTPWYQLYRRLCRPIVRWGEGKTFAQTGNQLLIRVSAFVRYWRKKWEYNEAVHKLFIDLKKACDSERREVLYSILVEFGVPLKLVRLINVFK